MKYKTKRRQNERKHFFQYSFFLTSIHKFSDFFVNKVLLYWVSYTNVKSSKKILHQINLKYNVIYKIIYHVIILNILHSTVELRKRNNQ